MIGRTGRWVADDGVAYAVQVGGDGPPVLLLHGFTGSAADWQPFLPALRRATTTVAVDLLGHGASDAPRDPARHAVEWQAADIATMLRTSVHGPAHVVGYSFGARIALRLTVEAPDAVRSLFLVSPSPGIVDAEARLVRRSADEGLAEVLETGGIASFVTRWETLPIFAGEQAGPADERARLHDARLRNDPFGLAASLRGAGQGVMAPVVAAELVRIDVPVTIVSGARDAAGTARARAVAGAIEGSRSITLPDAGHAVHREEPQAFERLLVGHLVRSSWACSSDVCAGPSPTGMSTRTSTTVPTAARSSP